MRSLEPREVNCETYEALDETIQGLVGEDPFRWLFRGHRELSWSLAPRLERACKIRYLLETEDQMLSDFRSKAHLYANHVPASEDGLGWLSTMQHHGVPTRLLDWTYSAFVAMFFSVEFMATEDWSVIWAIDTKALDREFQTRALGILPSRYSRAGRFGPEHFAALAFPPTFETARFGLVAPMLPKFHVSRLSSQQGCFLINCNYRLTFEESLNEMMRNTDGGWLFRIKFSSSLRPMCLRRLMQLNVHPATLFPDLEGLARFITLKNELFPVLAASTSFDPTLAYTSVAYLSAKNLLRKVGRLDPSTVGRARDHALEKVRTEIASNGDSALQMADVVIWRIVADATTRAIDEEYLVLRDNRPTPAELEDLKKQIQRVRG